MTSLTRGFQKLTGKSVRDHVGINSYPSMRRKSCPIDLGLVNFAVVLLLSDVQVKFLGKNCEHANSFIELLLETKFSGAFDMDVHTGGSQLAPRTSLKWRLFSLLSKVHSLDFFPIVHSHCIQIAGYPLSFTLIYYHHTTVFSDRCMSPFKQLVKCLVCLINMGEIIDLKIIRNFGIFIIFIEYYYTCDKLVSSLLLKFLLIRTMLACLCN